MWIIWFYSSALVVQFYQPVKRQPHIIVKYTQTIRLQKPTNCLSVFDHFVGLALKELIICMLL